MNQDAITDNWSLQVIAELFKRGLPAKTTHTLDPDFSTDSFVYTDISYAAIAIETLFDFLVDLVLRNQLIVDERYTVSWQMYQGPLQMVSDQKIIKPYPFLNKPVEIDDLRLEFIERLCVTSGLRSVQRENELSWDRRIKSTSQYFSQILWGGASMLARSFAYEKSYTPYPIRKRFFLVLAF